MARMYGILRNPIVFMFSGQGSHYYHMGKELYQVNPVFTQWMNKLDRMVYQNTGLSIIDEIYHEKRTKADKLDQIFYTHPAIFMVEYALTQVLMESGIEPDFVLGASLGEFTSAVVAGAISVEEALECLLKQVELLKSYCRLGFMIAILGSPDIYHQYSAIYLHSELAAFNYSSHFVISGDSEKLPDIENQLKRLELIFQILPVQYGFHSTNIEPAGSEFKKLFGQLSMKKLHIPMISSLYGRRITGLDAGYFWEVARQPIHFQKTILELEKDFQFNYIDLGPSGTLASFVKNNVSGDSLSKVYDIMTPFGQSMKRIEQLKIFLEV
jgi:bacillaene synthase trans-acting acyltransferase